MQFTNEYIEKNYPSFFKVYPVKVEEIALAEICDKAWKSKEQLRSLLPFNTEGRIDVARYASLYDVAMNAFSKTISVLSSLLQFYYAADIRARDRVRYLIDGKYECGKQTFKMSKILLDCAKNRLDFAEEFSLFDKDLCTELPRLPLHGKTDIPLIVQNFYSELASLKKEKTTLQLSINPIDILNASTGHVHSCNELGGIAQSAPLSAAMSTRIIIVRMVSSSGLLLGRCYMSFSENFKSILVQPIYGMMGHTNVEDALAWLRASIDVKVRTCADEKWHYSRDIGPAPTEIFAESATSNFYTDAPYLAMHLGTIQDSIPAMIVGSSYCTLCGKETPDLVCKKCEEAHFTRCEYCNKFIVKSTEKVCPTCAQNMRICKHSGCGRTFIAKKPTDEYCNKHLIKVTYCFICGQNIFIDRSIGEASPNYHTPSTIESVVPGVVFIHKECKTASKCSCGAPKSQYNFKCLACRNGSSFETNIRTYISRLRDYLTRLRRCITEVAPEKISDNLLLNKEDSQQHDQAA